MTSSQVKGGVRVAIGVPPCTTDSQEGTTDHQKCDAAHICCLAIHGLLVNRHG